MASVIIKLDGKLWHDIGANPVIVRTQGSVQLVNRTSPPANGVNAAAMEIEPGEMIVIPAPLEGNLFVRGFGSIVYFGA